MKNPLNDLSLLCLWKSPKIGKQIESMSDSTKVKRPVNEFTEKKLLYRLQYVKMADNREY